MLEQYNEFDAEWQIAELEIPFGRGINFQIEVAKIDPIIDQLTQLRESLVEEGSAQNKGLDWIYTAKVANADLSGDKITIQATDTPDNLSENTAIL